MTPYGSFDNQGNADVLAMSASADQSEQVGMKKAVTPVVQMLQGKWKLQILYELCIKCPMRFGELKKVLKPITNTALTNALKELEADELVQRIQYNEMPLRVEYSLTEKGRDLLPVFYAISQWGMKYIP